MDFLARFWGGVKYVVKWFVAFVEDTNGKLSSKRLIAVASFVMAAILAIKFRDLALAGAFLGLTTGVLIGQAATGT